MSALEAAFAQLTATLERAERNRSMSQAARELWVILAFQQFLSHMKVANTSLSNATLVRLTEAVRKERGSKPRPGRPEMSADVLLPRAYAAAAVTVLHRRKVAPSVEEAVRRVARAASMEPKALAHFRENLMRGKASARAADAYGDAIEIMNDAAPAAIIEIVKIP